MIVVVKLVRMMMSEVKRKGKMKDVEMPQPESMPAR